MYAEAGYSASHPLRMQLLYNTESNHRRLAVAMAAMWREVLGVNVRLRNQDWKVYLNSLSTLDYAVARSAWIGDVIDPINFLECFTTNNGNNRTGFSSAKYDLLIDKARGVADVSERYQTLQEAERLLLEESPIAPLYFYTRVYLKSPRVKGVEPNLLGYVDFKRIVIE